MRMLIQFLFFHLMFVGVGYASTPAAGYRIEVTIDNFKGDTLKLGYYFGKSQYLKDTALLDQGKYVFEGTESFCSDYRNSTHGWILHTGHPPMVERIPAEDF